MADRITCQHDPLKPGCSMLVESNWMGHRIRCRACDIAAVITKTGHIQSSPYKPAVEPRAADSAQTNNGRW